jgi:hypothetical protein
MYLEGNSYRQKEKINVTKEFQRHTSAIVAREISDAETFLKERLAVSIARRRNRFLYWKRRDKTSKIYVKKVMSSQLVRELEILQEANMQQVEDSNMKKQNRPGDGSPMSGSTNPTYITKTRSKVL